MRFTIIFLSLILLSATAASGAIWTVNPDGSGNCATIQAAVDTAGRWDIILLGDGVFTGMGNKDVAIAGKNFLTIRSLNGPAACTIDCEGTGRAFNITIDSGSVPAIVPDSTLVIEGVRVVNGNMPGSSGGGILAQGAPILSNLIVEDCSASNGGGISTSGARILHSTIRNCTATYGGNGGGIRNGSGIIAYCTIENNSATEGGGIWCGSYNRFATISFCRIEDNTASNGAGIFADDDTNVDNCEVINNDAHNGGGLYGDAVIFNCFFKDNDATTGGTGGGVYGDPGVTVKHSTFVANYADFYSAIYYGSVSNSILWGNAANNFSAIYGSHNNCCINDIGDIPGPPDFVTGPKGDYYLDQATSPCVDAGTSSASAQYGESAFGRYYLDRTTTSASDEAYDTGTGDLGYHYRPVTVYVYVPDEFGTIQAAIDGAAPLDTIVVRAGTYTENIDFNGKAVYLRSESGSDVTTINGGGSGNVVTFNSGEFQYSIIEGFEITAGNIGINCDNDTRPVIRDNWIIGNRFSTMGGGMFVENANPIVIGNTFEANTATAGGGMWVRFSSGIYLEDNVIALNVPNGIQAVDSQVDMYNNTIVENETGIRLVQGSSPWAENNIIALNTVAGVYVDYDESARFYKNDVWNNAGGAANWAGSMSDPTGTNGNINLDPQFCDLGVPRDYHLTWGSPCAAHNNKDGQIGALDVGCGGAKGITVKLGGGGDYDNIKGAIIAAAYLDTLILDKGIYQGADNRDIDFMGKAIIVRSIDDDPAGCVIDCQGTSGDHHWGFQFDEGEGPGSVVRGVSIINGYFTGGAAIRCDGASPTIENCVMTNNTTTHDGGAIHCSNSAGPVFTDCVIIDNASGDDGGAIVCRDGASAYLTRCVVASNAASDDGGAIYCTVSGHVVLDDCTVYDNYTPGNGGAIDLVSSSTLVMSNTIVVFNSGTNAVNGSTGAVTVTCCNVYGNVTGDYTGALTGRLGVDNNISADPLFCDAAGGNLELDRLSPCAASNNPSCGQIGVYGVGCALTPTTLVVNQSGGAHYTTIRDAITNSINGDIIELVDDTYTGPDNRDLAFAGRAITIRSQSGDPASCVINCEGSAVDNRRGFLFDQGEGPGSILQGLTIRNGYHTGGGAIRCDGTSPTIENCVFTQCQSSYDGGAVHCSNSAAPVFRECVITNNSAGDDGGAIVCRDGASADLIGCLVAGNTANDDGGAIYCTVSGHVVMDSCTVYGNQTGDHGGAAMAVTSSSLTIHSSILAANGGAEPVYTTASPVYLTCSDVYGNAGGDYVAALTGLEGVDGNISSDPVFCNAASGDYTLYGYSPCAPANNSCGVQMGCFGADCSATGIGDEAGETTPTAFKLDQNYPNPFNPSTTIAYDLPEAAQVTIQIYDVAGRLVRALVDGEVKIAGTHSVVWNGTNDHGNPVATGVYYYRIHTPTFTATKSMVLLK